MPFREKERGQTFTAEVSQERIGVHPSDWKLPEEDEALLRVVDDGIRLNMLLMLAGGFETFESRLYT